MIEIAMGICLTIMGVYFFKSTDLPKELKDLSTQANSVSDRKVTYTQNKITFPKVMPIASLSEENQDELAKLILLKKEVELKNLTDAIDKLTLTITALEQEIKTNNEKNSEIQSTIDTYLVTLQLEQSKISSLS